MKLFHTPLDTGFYTFAKLVLHFILELFELFKGLRFMPHQIDVAIFAAISAEVIRESYEVAITTSS